MDIKVADLFADYFSKTTFNNKGFVKSLIDDIWTLSRFQDTRKNGKNQESTFRLIGGVSRNIEEKTVSFKFLPDMDKNLIQSRIKYFMPISIVSLDTGNSNFHNFAILLHTHLFINKQNSLSKETVMTWMGIKKDYPNWKQVIEKNLDLFFKQIGITNAYTYSKKSGEFLFTTK